MSRRRRLVRAALVTTALTTPLPVVLVSTVAPAGARSHGPELVTPTDTDTDTDTDTTSYGPYTWEAQGRSALMSPSSTEPLGRRFK